MVFGPIFNEIVKSLFNLVLFTDTGIDIRDRDITGWPVHPIEPECFF